jgi:hypothetical protein
MSVLPTLFGANQTSVLPNVAATGTPVLDTVTASGTEINLIDGSVAGTAVANKAAVLGANKNLNEFHTAALYLGAAAGTAVTSTAAELNKIHGIAATAYMQVVESRSFTETAGAGTYTGAVVIPAGAIVLDVLWTNTATWAAATSATMKCGDVQDDDGFFINVNTKVAPAAGATISMMLQSTGSGSYKGIPKYYAAENTISGVVTTSGATGTTGRSVMHVIYALPTAVAATKA